MSTAKTVNSYSGTIAYDGSRIGTKVNRFDLLGDDLIVFDWISPPESRGDAALRLLGVAEKQRDGTYKSPWIYFTDAEGEDITDGEGARIVFQIAVSGNELRITGEWWAFDMVTRYAIEGLLTQK